MRVRCLRTIAAAGGAAALAGGTAWPPRRRPAPAVPRRGIHGARSATCCCCPFNGLHQQDLSWYVQHYPASALASLARRGLDYTDALTPVPSDSSPGMVAQATGGDPGVTGIYYDDTFNHDVFPAGTTTCPGPAPGAEVAFEEAIDVNQNSLDAGQGLSGLPGSILQMTSNPRDVINPANLPVSAQTCQPIYPNQYLEVNTIFNVARQAGLRTAWSDKHPAYQMSRAVRARVQDFSRPRSTARLGYPAGDDWTKDNAATMQYDSYKVQAILNEIDGYNHSRTSHVGVPGIFGMNFQTVSTAEKLPASDGLAGGYLPGGKVPGPLLVRALNYVDTQVGEHGRRDQGAGTDRQHDDHPLGQARPVPDQPRPTSSGSRTPRSSPRSTRPGRRPTPGRAPWSSSPPTTTACCGG